MTAPRPSLYPAAAPAWMAGERPARILDIGSGNGSFARLLLDGGHEVFCVDRDYDEVALLPAKLGTRLHLVGRVEALPFLACHFDVVSASQSLHRFAPGLALAEIARVLRPGGHLAVAYNTRDDTVPWVRRLTALMRAADPTAMTGDYGVESVEAVLESPYFTQVERRNFRNWLPITRSGLVAMVERQPWTARLDPDVRAQLLHDVGDLYDSSARPPEPLLLPFQASCWRALVDHSQLAMTDDIDSVLEIRL
jgi:SAM-dependent methyltransferase